MKNITATSNRISIILFAFITLISAIAAAKDLTAKDIVQKSSEADKLSGWSAKIVMRLLPKSGQERIRESIISNKLQPNGSDMQRLVHFVAPADINGTNILIHEHQDGNDDIWIYLPSMKKVRRLLSNNRKDSFMGTDFSYTDITTPKVNEYVHTLLRREDAGGSSCFVIESIPKTEQTRKDTGYSKTVNWIRADNYARVKAEIFDLSGGLSKTMQVHSLKEVDKQRGKWLMEKVEMRNLQTGHTTMLLFNDIITSEALNDKLFAPNRLDKE